MHAFFSPHPVVIALQVAAILLMIWARIAFGLRSFHAVASPTAGGLITTGPYRFIRHPIYASTVSSSGQECSEIFLQSRSR